MIESDLWGLLEARAAQTPDAIFGLDEREQVWTFAELKDQALAVAGGLSGLGIGPRSMVSWQLPNWLEAISLSLALSYLRSGQNPLIPILRHREVSFITSQATSDLLVTPPVFRGFDFASLAHEVAGERAGLGVLVVDGSLPRGEIVERPAPLDDGEAPWYFYTSGTTADPKGAMHTDATLTAAVHGLIGAFELSSDDRVALILPLTHVGGIILLIAALQSG